MKFVDESEAKTHLLALLEEVARGSKVTITKDGHAVAMLVPAQPHRHKASEAAEKLRAQRAGRVLDDDLSSHIADGRR